MLYCSDSEPVTEFGLPLLSSAEFSRRSANE